MINYAWHAPRGHGRYSGQELPQAKSGDKVARVQNTYLMQFV
jgi:hypothetical protein